MAFVTKLPLAILFLAFLILISCSDSAASKTTTSRFILRSCKTATYPYLCVKTLTPYAAAVQTSRFKLCSSALTVAIQSTTTCRATVTKLSKQSIGLSRRESRAINDCIGHLKDAAVDLRKTSAAISRLSGAGRESQWGNAKTYGSAAITDVDTCVDAVKEGKVRPVLRKKIRNCVDRAEQVMSNALFLINHLY